MFIENWKAQVKHLWSIKLALLSAVFGILEQVLPALLPFVPPNMFAALSIATAVCTAIARVIKQQPPATA
jgi:uncharacterized membrane protein